MNPPIEYVPFILAERFPGTSPETYMDMSADRRAHIINVLGVEGSINRQWAEANADVEPGTDVVITEWEYDLWDDD